jgi:DNA-binding SARP family transcriptional activator
MADLEIRVLGPVEILQRGCLVNLQGRTITTLIAGLAVAPNRTVSVDRLIDYVWDAKLPEHPRAALHNGFSRLRRILGADVVECLGWGYRLRPDCAEFDVLRFEDGVAAADRAARAGREDEALAALETALRLWREPVLGNVDSALLRREAVPRLTERYLEITERRAELCLRRGDFATLVAELPAVVHSYRTRERLAGQLMTALTAVGRRADAVVTYRAMCQSLRDELDIEPGSALREIHARISRADALLNGSETKTSGQATSDPTAEPIAVAPLGR